MPTTGTSIFHILLGPQNTAEGATIISAYSSSCFSSTTWIAWTICLNNFYFNVGIAYIDDASHGLYRSHIT